MTVFAKISNFSDFPKIPILDHLLPKTFKQDTCMLPSSLLILLVPPYIYHLLQK